MILFSLKVLSKFQQIFYFNLKTSFEYRLNLFLIFTKTKPTFKTNKSKFYFLYSNYIFLLKKLLIPRILLLFQ